MTFSVWLIPTDEHSRQLRDLINCFAQENASPAFIPHCTLLTKIQNFSSIPIDKIESFCSHTKPFKLNVLNITGGETLYKSLYIQFKRDDFIMEIQQNFSNLFNNREPYLFDPHLSLMYKIVPPEKQVEIISNISIQNRINFDQISIVKTGKIVEEWNIAHSKKLSG